MSAATEERNESGQQASQQTQAITPTEPKPQRLPVTDSGPFADLMDTARFEHLWRVAQAFARSQLVPQHFRQKPDDCLIACQMALRLGVDPFMFMQNTYVVHGRPGMEAKLAIALINSSGLFKGRLKYERIGDDAKKPTYRCRAWAVDAETGERVDGPWITWEIVKAERWDQKDGSKWLTMPALMFDYRAATWFGRTNCPERLMGMQTADELEDSPPPPRQVESRTVSSAIADMRSRLTPEPSTPSETIDQKTGEVLNASAQADPVASSSQGAGTPSNEPSEAEKRDILERERREASGQVDPADLWENGRKRGASS